MPVCMSLCTTFLKLSRVAEHWTHVINALLEIIYIYIYIYTDIQIYIYILEYICIYCYYIAAADTTWSQYEAD